MSETATGKWPSRAPTNAILNNIATPSLIPRYNRPSLADHNDSDVDTINTLWLISQRMITTNYQNTALYRSKVTLPVFIQATDTIITSTFGLTGPQLIQVGQVSQKSNFMTCRAGLLLIRCQSVKTIKATTKLSIHVTLHRFSMCKKTAKHTIWTRRLLWITVDGRSW